MTLQQRFLKYFKAQGFQQIVSRTRKYIVLYMHDGETVYKDEEKQRKDVYIFLGNNGAVRQGNSAASTQSFSRSEIYLIRMEMWERKQEKYQ